MDHTGIEEDEHYHQSRNHGDGQEAHTQVAVGTQRGRSHSARLAAQLTAGKTHGVFDDAPALDDADDTSHGDGSDADIAGIVGEDELRIGLREHHRIRSCHAQQRDDEPPDEERAGTDDAGIFQTDNIAEAQHGSTGIDGERELNTLGDVLAPGGHTRRQRLMPPAERADHEVIQTANSRCPDERACLTAALLTADEHLRGGRGLGERVFTVHVLHEITAERYQEQDSQTASQQRSKEDLEEVDRNLRILGLQDVQRGQRKDGSCHDDARRGSDALDDDVLAQGALALGGGAQTHGDDGDGNGGLEDLSHLQTQIGSGRREDDRHDNTPRDAPRVDLGVLALRTHQRLIALACLQFAERVVGEGSQIICLLVFTHLISLFLYYSEVIS